tara:strand:- start:652 stop:1956 length:1305 start_codon:yes stop_codon:yes gene_type:complete
MNDPHDPDAENARSGDVPPGEESGTAKDAQAEYLKPGTAKRARKSQDHKKPRVLEGSAEEVRQEKPGKPESDVSSSQQPSGGGTGMSGLLAAGAAGAGGAAIALGVVWALGLVPVGQDGAIRTDLDTRIEALETGGDGTIAAMNGKIDALAGRVGTVEESLSAAAETPDSATAIGERFQSLDDDTQQVKQALNDTRETLRSMQQKIGGIEANMPPEGIASQVNSLDSLVKALDLRLASLAPEIDDMETRVAALEAKKEDPDAAARAALGLALANLARAAESPGPFATELDAVAAFLPNEPALGGLSDAAAAGVPTRAALEARFPSLVQTILDAERHAAEDGLWSRFLSNVTSLVTVRRTGEISGDTTKAVIARMEERLKVHDLSGAVNEAGALQGPAARAAKPWIDDAEARLRTDILVRELSADVAARLAKAGG